MKSAMRPRIVKVAQKIFRSMYQVYRLCEWELYVFSTPESLRAATILYSPHGEGAQSIVAWLIQELTAESLPLKACAQRIAGRDGILRPIGNLCPPTRACEAV